MSHFCTHVLVVGVDPKDEAAVEAEVGRLLAPFDENLQVPEYMRDCWCVGRAAAKAAREAADEKVGDIDSFRKSFAAKVEEELAKDKKALVIRRRLDKQEKLGEEDLTYFVEARGKIEEAIDWQAHIKPYVDAEAEALEAHAMKGKPDPKCEDCKGTGKEPSTYNPKSKWDYWRVGGRWDGIVSGTEAPSEDNGFNFGRNHEDLVRNSIPVPLFVDLLAAGKTHLPFALVTRDGEWHEKGDMGWWGMVAGEKKPQDWQGEVARILAAHQDAFIVACDLHI